MSSEVDLVTAELFKADQQHDLGLSIRNNDIWIRCPFHGDGREHTPSMRVSIEEGGRFFLKAKCHGCGWGPKHYNELATHFGLLKTDKNFKAVGVRQLGFLKRDAKIQRDERDFKLSTFDWPEGREWRQIPGRIVLKNKGVLTDTRNDLDEPRLAFPVSVWNETKGYIYALLHDPQRDARGKKTEIPYLNSSGPWKEKYVFGFDRARRLLKKYPNKPLWIVEGPRDKLWLDTAGCIVVGTLGSSFSEEKAELVRLLNPKRTLVATDNDAAGDKVADEISERLEGLPKTRIRWRPGEDPCDNSIKRLKYIDARFTH